MYYIRNVCLYNTCVYLCEHIYIHVIYVCHVFDTSINTHMYHELCQPRKIANIVPTHTPQNCCRPYRQIGIAATAALVSVTTVTGNQ